MILVKVDVAEAALVTERDARRNDAATMANRLADSEASRQKLSSGLQDITKRFNDIQIPPAKTLVRTVEVPGACSKLSVGPEFVSVWNAASSP